MKKNGFTLVELIAVLVILSIIALMAAPNIIRLMQNSKENSFVSEAEEMVSTAKYMYKSMTLRDQFFTDGTTIKMKDLKGTIPENDPYGYAYKTEESYISIIEPTNEDESAFEKRTIKVFLKTCKDETETKCHYICSTEGDNLKNTDIKTKYSDCQFAQ